MKKMRRNGWHNDSFRHGLAAKGIMTKNRYMKVSPERKLELKSMDPYSKLMYTPEGRDAAYKEAIGLGKKAIDKGDSIIIANFEGVPHSVIGRASDTGGFDQVIYVLDDDQGEQVDKELRSYANLDEDNEVVFDA